MSRSPLRGFADFRTRPIERPEPKPKRRCRQCKAVLRESNTGDMCAPCAGARLPEEIPSWAVALIDDADNDEHAAEILIRTLCLYPQPSPGDQVEMLKCKRCGEMTPRRHPTQLYCFACARERRRELSRECVRRRYRKTQGKTKPNKGKTQAETIFTCAMCGVETTRRYNNQRYCPSCAKERRRETNRECARRYYARKKQKGGDNHDSNGPRASAS
jgi:hypothetical protein